MKKQLLKTMLLLFALIAGSSSAWAGDPDLTLDFTTAWTAGADNASGEKVFTKTINEKTYTISGKGGANFKFNSGYFIFGKSGAYINLPKVDFDVEKIEVVGRDGASSSVIHNIFVGETAVSTPITGITGTNSFAIGSSYQAANTQYILKITSSHNAQVTYIKYYEKGNGGAAEPVAVTGVTVDPTEWEMEVGDTKELTATVAPAEATNKNVTWSSNKESVATVSDAGVVTAVAAGTATITVTTTDGSKTATCDITVNEAAPEPAADPVAVTFDFAKNDFSFPEGNSNKTTKSNNYSYGGYTFNLAGGGDGNGYYYNTSGYLLLGKTGCSLTFPAFGFNVSKIKVYGTSGASTGVKQNIFVGETAVSTETTGAKNVTNEYEIAEAYQAAGNVYVLKVTSNANTQISKIEIVGYLNTPAVTAAGWASYVTEKAMRFDEGEAFAVTAAGSGSVTLTEVTDVPKYFPVLLKGAGAKKGYVLEESPAAPANLLAISTGGEINGYVLANKTEGVGFYKWAGGSLTSGKVYLPASAVAGAPDFLGFEGEATGVNEVKEVNEVNDNSWYNLAGQRVANPTKGLYIVNGKKVIIK